MNTNKKLLFSTDVYDDIKESYKNYCEDNIIKVNYNSYNFDDFYDTEYNFIYSDFINFIKKSTYNAKSVIFRELRLWQGKHIIEPNIYYTLIYVIEKCIKNSDYFDIYLEDNHINIKDVHYNRINNFNIYLLKDDFDKDEDDLFDMDNYKKIEL